MIVRFLIDAQLPVGLVNLFTEAGHEAIHVAKVGLLSASDSEVRAYAAKRGMVIVTKDEDFTTLRSFSTNAPRVVWVRIGNTTNRALEARMRSLMAEILEAFAAGEEIVEVR